MSDLDKTLKDFGKESRKRFEKPSRALELGKEATRRRRAEEEALERARTEKKKKKKK